MCKTDTAWDIAILMEGDITDLETITQAFYEATEHHAPKEGGGYPELPYYVVIALIGALDGTRKALKTEWDKLFELATAENQQQKLGMLIREDLAERRAAP